MNAPNADIARFVSNVFSCISRGLAITVIIFLTAQYFKPKSNHKSAYFVILNIGYVMDLMLFFNWLLPMFLPLRTGALIIVLEWHQIYFTTIWNFVLCLNRCTALAFFTKYERIWRPLSMSFIIPFMIGFPFIIDGNSLFASGCDISDFKSCQDFRTDFYFMGTIVNAILNGFGIFLIVLSMYKSSHDKFRANSTHAKNERRLIYQAIFSSILQLINFAIKYSVGSNTNPNFFLYLYISDTIWHFHHLVVMGSHFILSASFKTAFLEFYHLKFLLPQQKTIVVSQIITKTVKTFTPTSSIVTIK